MYTYPYISAVLTRITWAIILWFNNVISPFYSPCFPHALKWKILPLKTFTALSICIALHKLKARPCKYLVTQVAYSCKAFQWRQIDHSYNPDFSGNRPRYHCRAAHYLVHGQTSSSPDLHPQPLHSVPLHHKFNPSLGHEFALQNCQITSVHCMFGKAWLGFIRVICTILLSWASVLCTFLIASFKISLKSICSYTIQEKKDSLQAMLFQIWLKTI